MKTGMNRYSSASTDQTPSAQWRRLSRDLPPVRRGGRRRGERSGFGDRHLVFLSFGHPRAGEMGDDSGVAR